VVNRLDFQSATALRFGIGAAMILVYLLLVAPWRNDRPDHAATMANAAGYRLCYRRWCVVHLLLGLKRITASVSTICELAWPLSAVVLDYFLNGMF